MPHWMLLSTWLQRVIFSREVLSRRCMVLSELAIPERVSFLNAQAMMVYLPETAYFAVVEH